MLNDTIDLFWTFEETQNTFPCLGVSYISTNNIQGFLFCHLLTNTYNSCILEDRCSVNKLKQNLNVLKKYLFDVCISPLPSPPPPFSLSLSHVQARACLGQEDYRSTKTAVKVGSEPPCGSCGIWKLNLCL